MHPSTAARCTLRPELPAAPQPNHALAAIAGPAEPANGETPRPDADCWRALLGDPRLGPAELEALGAIALTRQVAQGAAVFSRADCASSVVALAAGVVVLGFRTAGGALRAERIVRAPAWLDLSSAWLDGQHAMDARASTASLVVDLPAEALQSLLARRPELARGVIRGLAEQARTLAANTHELMYKDAPGRLAQWLLLRSEPAPGRDGQRVVHLRERKRDVASQLAITPETLSRLMRSFSLQGVLEVAGYTVSVLDAPALARLAQA